MYIFFKRNYYSKIFGCLHNSLFKLLKKQDKNTKINKFECRLEIDIKIKCSNIRGKKSDPYLKVNIFVDSLENVNNLFYFNEFTLVYCVFRTVYLQL